LLEQLVDRNRSGEAVALPLHWRHLGRHQCLKDLFQSRQICDELSLCQSREEGLCDPEESARLTSTSERDACAAGNCLQNAHSGEPDRAGRYLHAKPSV
jgi:hypothetical protein